VQYLVTMTTRVPEGTAEQEVDDVRAREAAHTGDLARSGRILRLWRPPLQPGEWRTLGLFSAADPDDLEEVLASMPLRVWRTDEVTPLVPHPNDPGAGVVAVDPARTEFLTTFTVDRPSGADTGAFEQLGQQEGQRTSELAADGHLLRLWRLPGEDRNLGHWQADDVGQLAGLLASLPLAAWLGVETLALTRHPSDPLLTSG
jgi:muconolactone delta-isomerase